MAVRQETLKNEKELAPFVRPHGHLLERASGLSQGAGVYNLSSGTSIPIQSILDLLVDI